MRHTCHGSVIIERLGAFLDTRMQTGQSDLEEAGIVLVVLRIPVITKRQLDIENLLQSDSIRGTTETEGGMRIARDESLPRVVAKAKLAKVIAAAGKIFMREWSKSTKE